MAIAASKAALDECVTRLERGQLAFIAKTSAGTFSEAQATRETVHMVKDEVRTVSSDVGVMIRAILETINNGQRETRNHMEDIFQKYFQEFMAANMQTGLYRMVAEDEYRRSESLVPGGMKYCKKPSQQSHVLTYISSRAWLWFQKRHLSLVGKRHFARHQGRIDSTSETVKRRLCRGRH